MRRSFRLIIFGFIVITFSAGVIKTSSRPLRIDQSELAPPAMSVTTNVQPYQAAGPDSSLENSAPVIQTAVVIVTALFTALSLLPVFLGDETD